MSSDEKIRKAYYDEGNLFGRDALFHLLKKKYPKSHPSKNEIEAWLGKQELQQLHKQTRKGGATDRFRPSKPWDNISMDLIDYSGRSAPNGKKYILVVVDNFSRFVLVRPMLNKEAKTTARHLTSILDEIKKLTKGVDIKNIITDDGSEFLTTQRTRKVCPDGAGSCGDPFRRSEVCIDSSERQRVEQLTSVGSLNLVSQ